MKEALNKPINTDEILESLPHNRVQGTSVSGRIFTAILFAIFLFALLISLWMGVKVYGNLHDLQTQTTEDHLQLNLLANKVRSNDMMNAVGVGEGPEGKALVLTQTVESGTYETRFYLYNGKIVEEFTLATSSYNPAQATPVVEASTFDFTYADNLLCIYADSEEVDVALRSVKGGA